MSIKTAQTNIEINPLIANRWSPRAFLEKDVESEKLKKIFEAARWAASSSNEQPWRFIVGQKTSPDNTWQRLFDTLVEGNKEWVFRAPVLSVAVAKHNFSYKDVPNKHFAHDVGQAMANICIQSIDLGLYIHQMAGFSSEGVRNTFNIPVGYEALTMFCIGYLADPDILNEKNKKTEMTARVRKELSEICLAEWNRPFSF